MTHFLQLNELNDVSGKSENTFQGELTQPIIHVNEGPLIVIHVDRNNFVMK